MQKNVMSAVLSVRGGHVKAMNGHARTGSVQSLEIGMLGDPACS